MAGATHQIQIRHILVEKKEVADLLKETIEGIPRNCTGSDVDEVGRKIQHLLLL